MRHCLFLKSTCDIKGPEIKFTTEHSRSSTNFLDVTVIIDNSNQLTITLHFKPTDSHSYLLYSSEHPRHLGIPYSQFLRVRRICSKLIDFCKNALMLSTHFLRRGYSKHLIESTLQRAEHLVRPTPLSKNAPTNIANILINKNNENCFYLVTTDNPANPSYLLKRAMPCLQLHKK